MAKISFASMKLKTDISTKEVEFADIKFNILNYLPMRDKIDLIQIALQKSESEGVYNELLLDVYFHLNLIYLYTDLNFTEKQREDELKLFDVIKSSGLLDVILKNINEEEYEYLVEKTAEIKNEILEYGNSAGSVIRSIVQDLPKNAEAAKDIVESFDPKKYKAVIDFANAAGNNGNKVVPFNVTAD